MFVQLFVCSGSCYLSRKLAKVLVLLHQVGSVAHIVTAHHAVGGVHANGVDGEPAYGRNQSGSEYIIIVIGGLINHYCFSVCSHLSIPISSPSRSVNLSTSTCLSVFHLYLKTSVTVLKSVCELKGVHT